MMFIRRFFLIGSLGLIMAMAVQPSSSHAEVSEDKAKAFISGLADQAIEALTMPNISQVERENRFRILLNENFAIKTIARWVIGRHWKKATESEKAEYLKLFEELLTVTYVNKFSEYAGQNLDVVKSLVSSTKDAVVFSEIVREGTQPVHVDWQVRSRDNVTFKIVDVKVEGVSMGQTQKSEFSSVIRQNNGKVEALLAVLRKRVS